MRPVADSFRYAPTSEILQFPRLFASKSDDHTIRLWSCETWETVAVIPAQKKPEDGWIPALAFHPMLPLLATAGSAPDAPGMVTPDGTGDRNGIYSDSGRIAVVEVSPIATGPCR